ncbi:acetyl-CoA carboxylase biotin carboxyl carrier protein [Melittangium boletus]|uniref:Biotin carboxyl carrier protein of acetyl-CoA carboxylase n=1 Tax=Melittangium boletus DSM 14713 TaxID=1294270 RepID=A0A250I9V3_9BACT|nr:acetyl-CoA carboxylase biotin carboxyl carrier protein [Melittangium boletus]ATB27978.1 acetyl-CoA carboxylase biotin carboxyl carrier protein subunit [Melittangium boletus DSM 14713]
MASKRKAIRTESAPVARSESVRVEGNTTSLDVESLRQIVEILEASEVTRLVWQRGDERLLIRRGPVPAPTIVHAAPISPSVSPAPVMAAAPVAAAPAPAAPSAAVAAAPVAAPAEKPGHSVTSPFVGTFYRTPAPDQPSFVEVGSVVKKGQVLCIIEAMKLMNEIEADVAGRVAEILVENGQPVEFGQALFRIEPV